MNKLFTIIILGSTALVSADQYQPSCRSGNCQAGSRSQQQNQVNQQDQRYNSQQGYRSDRFVPRYFQQENEQANRGYQNSKDKSDNYNDSSYNDNDNDDNDDNDDNTSVASDLGVFKKTQKALSSGMFSRGFDNIYFDVDGGYVTLRGTVDTAENKNKAEQNVKAIEGVKGVTNKITISNSASGVNATKTGASQDFAATAEDKQLNDTIRNRLRQWLSTKNVDALVIKNKNGEVVLIGTVDKAEDVKKADADVKAIAGVKRLDNRLMATTDANLMSKDMPQDSSLTPKDKELNARIRQRLGSWLDSRNVEAMMIKTKNGDVVIIGTVEKPEDIEKVNYQLKDIEGINHIDNQLKVKK